MDITLTDTSNCHDTKSLENARRYEIDYSKDVNKYLKSNYERNLSYMEDENKILKNHIIEYEIIRIEKENLESLNAKLSSDNIHMGKKIECLRSENNLLRDCVGNLEKKLISYNNLVRERDQLRAQVAKEKDNIKDSNHLQQIVKTVTSQRDALSLQLSQQKELAENSLRQKSNEILKQKEICDKLLVLTNQLYSQNEHLQNVLFVLSSTKEFYRKCCYMKLEHLHRKLFEAESTKCLLSDKRFDLSLRKVKMILHVVEYFQEINLPSSQINLLMKAVRTALSQLSGEMEDLSQSLCKAFDNGDCKNLSDQTSRTFSDPDISGKALRIDSSKSLFFSPKNTLMALCPDDKSLVERLFSSKAMQVDKSTANESILKQSWLDELEKENQNLKLILSNTNKEVEHLNDILSEKRKTLGKYQQFLNELKSEIEIIYDTHSAKSDSLGNQDSGSYLVPGKAMHKSFKLDNPSGEFQDRSQTESEFFSLQKMVSSLKCGRLNEVTTESKVCKRINVTDQNEPWLKTSCEVENDVVCPHIKSSEQEMLEHSQLISNSEEKLDEKLNVCSLGKQFLMEESKTKPSGVFSPQKLSLVRSPRATAQKLLISLRLTEDLHCILKKLERFPSLHQIFSKNYPLIVNLFLNFRITIEPIRELTNDAMIFVNLDEFKDKEIPALLLKISQVHSSGDLRVFFSKYSQENYLCIFAPLTGKVSNLTVSINIDSSLSLKLPRNNSDSIFEKLSKSGSCGKYFMLHKCQPHKGYSLPHSTQAGFMYSNRNPNHIERTNEILNPFEGVSARAITSDELCKLNIVAESGAVGSNPCNASLTTESISSQEISKASGQNSSKNPVHEVSKYSLVVRTSTFESFQKKGINTQLCKLVSQLKLNQHDLEITDSLAGIRICEIKILLLSVLKQYLSSIVDKRNTQEILRVSDPSSLILLETSETSNKATAIQPRNFPCTPEIHSDLIFSVSGVMESINDVYSNFNKQLKVQEMNLVGSVTDTADISASSHLLCGFPQTSQENNDCPLTQSSSLTFTEVPSHEICESWNSNIDIVNPKRLESVCKNRNSSYVPRQLKAVPKLVKFSKKNWFTEINTLRLKIYRLRKQFMNFKLEYSSLQKLEHSKFEKSLETLNASSVPRNEAEIISGERNFYKQKVADLQKEILMLKENLNTLSKPAISLDKEKNANGSQSSCEEEETDLKESVVLLEGCENLTNEPFMPKDVPDSANEGKYPYESTIAVKDVRKEKNLKSEENVNELSKTMILKDQSETIREVQSSYEQKIANLKEGFEEKLIQLKSSHNKDFKALSQIYVEKLKLAEEIYSQSIENTEESNLQLLKDYQHFYASKLNEWESLMDQFSRTLLNLQKILSESEEKFSAELSTAVNKYETLLRLVSEAFDNEKVTIHATLCESLRKFEAEYKESLKVITEQLNNEAAFSRRLILKELDSCKKQYDSSLKKQQLSYKILLEEAKKSYERKQSQRSLHLSFSKVLNCNCDRPEGV